MMLSLASSQSPSAPKSSPPARENPSLYERTLLYGVESLGDHELLALLLGRRSREPKLLARSVALLETYGGVQGIASQGLHSLLAMSGLGETRAACIAAALELGRRSTFREPVPELFRFTQFEQVVKWARPRLAGLEHEEVWLLVLDAKNHLKALQRVASGGVHGCALTVKDVLRPALRAAGTSILLVHNHPSGDPEPSQEDVVMTLAIRRACEVVGVPLLDHVIVAENGAYSLFDHEAFGM
ncbi:MAG: DNA repair protein RadC [Polyangiaceae bacterium]|nr:DNA repair protein RadC [Polyangiaceae bacterium]